MADRGPADVFYRYALAFDENEPERYADVFTEDAVLVAGPNPLEGRDAIVEMMVGRIAARGQAGQQTRHAITNVLAEEATETTARVRAYFLLAVTGPDGKLVLERSGWYRDELVLEAGTWRIARHEMGGDQPA